jgi:multiple sugar transport system permease protein
MLPVLWMVAAALHPQGVPLPTTLQLLPGRISLGNFGRIFTIVPLLTATLRSLLIVTLAVPLTLITGSWAGFAMARLPRASQRRWVTLSLAMLMVPSVALWSTRFIIYERLGILNSVFAVIAPALMGSSPFFVLMFYRAFHRVPVPIYEAARLDGAGVLQTWSLIALPLARPTAVGVALLTFVLYWGDFISPLLYMGSNNLTLPVALQTLQQLSRSDWPLLMAGAVWAMLIPILLLVSVQYYFTRRER